MIGFAQVPTPDGLISWWQADDEDDSIGANDAILNGSVDFDEGRVGNGFHITGAIDGVDDNVEATSFGLPTGNSDRTLEFWVNAQQFGPNESFLAGYGAFGSFDSTYGVGTFSDGTVFFSQWGGAVRGPSLHVDQWYHIAVTNVGNSVILYVDGEEVGSGEVTINTASETFFYMGQIGGDEYRKMLRGVIDEVSVYDRALCPGEVRSIHQANKGKFSQKHPDCNENGTPDLCDIDSGDSEDVDGDGLPDECRCEPTEPDQEISCEDGADNDCDGEVDETDADCQIPQVGPFVRGDCDGNGVVGGSPTEAIVLLGFAFRGGEEPACMAACDAEANGSLGVTDALRILRHAFLGLGEPDPPFPDCTKSDLGTDVELGCLTPAICA